MNLNPFSSARKSDKAHPFNDNRTQQQQAVETLWESYKTLAVLESNPTHNIALQSPEAQAANQRELARLRKLFKDVPESLTIDPARPAELDAA